MHKYSVTKADGRTVTLYSREAASYQPAVSDPAPSPSERADSHMRWHPLRNEWVSYAAARQNRTFKPPAAYCPLCPGADGAFPTEIPFTSFEVAVFDNKFPAFHPGTMAAPAHPLLDTAPGRGKCEVVVYSADHRGSLADLPQERLELLVRAWNDRYAALRGQDGIRFVMPFENRGEEAGVTLHHPHGQIYAYSYIPPVLEQAVASFRKDRIVSRLMAGPDFGRYIVTADAHIAAFVPPFARYPFECWIAARRSVPGPWAFNDNEISSFAATLRHVVRAYDKMFGRVSPYIYVMHAAPAGEDDYFEFTAQFYPLLRDPHKLKYLAGCEQGAGSFLNDVLPEDAAAKLKDAAT